MTVMEICVMILFKIRLNREIKGFNNVLNSFNIFDVESEVLDVGWVAVMLAYDWPNEGELNTWRRVGMFCVWILTFFGLFADLSVFCKWYNLYMMLYVHQSIVHI